MSECTGSDCTDASHGHVLFARNPVNSKFGWARDDETATARPVVLRSYKDKRKAKNRARKNAQRHNRK